MKIVFQDPTFSLQLLRAIGETYYKGADIGECLSTSYRIKEGDFESWYKEWLNTAQRVHKYAENSLAAGHKKAHVKLTFVLQIITGLQSFSLWFLKIQEFKQPVEMHVYNLFKQKRKYKIISHCGRSFNNSI